MSTMSLFNLHAPDGTAAHAERGGGGMEGVAKKGASVDVIPV